MKKFFKFLFIFLLIAVIASFIGGYFFLKNFNLNQYKNTIEEQVYKYTGRTLHINGNAHLGISLFPTLIIDDISLSNAVWAQNPQMLNLKSLQIEVEIMPLLQKNIVINSIKLIQPQIYLEKSTSGIPNWNFTPTEKITSQTDTLFFAQLQTTSLKTTSGASSPLPDFIKNISIQKINIQNGLIQYIDSQKNKTETIDISNLNLNMDNLDSPINIDIEAQYQKQPISATLIINSFNDLFVNNKPLTLQASAQAYNINASITGSVDNIFSSPSYKLTANIYNPASNLNLPETTLETDIIGDLTQIKATIKTLNIAENNITGSISANISSKIPSLNIDLQSQLIDLRSLQANEPLALELNIINQANAAEYIPSTPIPYDIFSKINGNLKLKIKQLIINNAITAQNIDLNTSIANGILKITPLNLNFGNGSINLNATLNAKKQTLSLTLNSKDILLQDLHKEFVVTQKGDFGVLSGGKTTIHADLTSQGNTYRQLVQNLNGDFVFVVSESNIQTGSLHFLTDTFIEQLFKVLKIDTQKSTNVNVQCAVINSNLGQGKANFPQSIALQSDKLTLSSTGTINLINDKIDFSLAPAFNFDSGMAQTLSSLIKIEGTVQKPQIKLDDKQAFKTIVGIATTGASAYIGSQLISDGSPCYTALKGTKYQNLVPTPSVASQTTQNIVDATSTAIDDTKNAVKKELKNLEQNAKDFFNMLKGK